jgi:hypothetical protein
MGRGRLEAFSDGVIAIIITIMVLEMKVPHGDSLDDLLPLLPVFLSYVLSFVYVGIYWNLQTPEEITRNVQFDEPALVAELGMRSMSLPVRGTAEYPYSPATVAEFADAVSNAKGKSLLHRTVAWRASHLWAAYLIKERGIPTDSALANPRAINLMDDHRMGPTGANRWRTFSTRCCAPSATRASVTAAARA